MVNPFMAESNLQVLDAAEELAELSDSELVNRYVQTKSTADFELIVARYARLVMGVCRRVLQHPEDAEDAFQATFVVLAQSVHKLKKRESLGSWLHGVAYRIGRRHAHELYRKRMSPLAGEPMSDEDGLKSLETRFEQQLLDEELQRVSEHYREVLVLRYLEEKSSREISETLGVSIGTVEGRLQRGKAELRRRLLRRGVTATGVLISVELLRNTASASVTSTLIQQTATTAVAASAGGLTSTVVTSLAMKEIAVMSASKLAFITACIVLPVTLMLPGDGEISSSQSVAFAQLGRQSLGGQAGFGQGRRVPKRVIDTSVKWQKNQEQAKLPVGLTPAANRHPLTVQVKDEKGTLMSMKVTQSQLEAMMSQLKNTMTAADSKDAEHLPAHDAESGGGSGFESQKEKAALRKKHEAVDYYDQSPAEQKILAAIEDGTEIEFLDTPLADAMQYVSDLHDITVIIDDKGLEGIGLQSDEPLSINLSGVTLKSALKLILEPKDLAYVIEDEVMKITSKDVANGKMKTKVYEIRDIAADPEALIGAITAGTETSWLDVDGTGGTISALPGSLVIKQTYDGHRQIVDLLEQIRRHNTNPLYQRVQQQADPFSGGDYGGGDYGGEMYQQRQTISPIIEKIPNTTKLFKAPAESRITNQVEQSPDGFSDGNGHGASKATNPKSGRESTNRQPRMQNLRIPVKPTPKSSSGKSTSESDPFGSGGS